MSNNSKIKQTKLNPKGKAIYSLILGIISIILPIIVIKLYGGHGSGPMYREYPGCIVVTGICAILGLVFSIRGLKSARRKLAIAGMIVCVIGLLFWIFFFGNWLIFIFL